MNGYLQEKVLMTHPPSFEQLDSTLVYMLNKSFYGLKQALEPGMKSSLKLFLDLAYYIANVTTHSSFTLIKVLLNIP